MFRANGKVFFNLERVMPAIMDKISMPFEDLEVSLGSSDICCGLQPKTRRFGFASRSSETFSYLVIPVSLDSASEVPSLAEQQEISFA